MKPKIFLRISDDTGTGDFQFEYKNLHDLKTCVEAAFPHLLNKGKMIAEQLTLPIQVGGIPIQQSETFPANWKLQTCLNDLKRRKKQFSSYEATPDKGYKFNLI